MFLICYLDLINLFVYKNLYLKLFNFIIGYEIPKSFVRWKITFPWLMMNDNGKVICSSCSETVKKQLLVPSLLNSRHVLKSRQAFVDCGFDTWKNAIKIF